MTILIFPAGMPRAISFLNDCLKHKKSVIGASSLLQDPSRTQYPKWAYLPYINQPDFANELNEVIQREGVTQIYTANPVVWDILKRTLPKVAPNIALLGDSPATEMLDGHRSSKQVAQRLWEAREFLSLGKIAKPRMRQTEFGSLVRHTDLIPGMCDHQKMLALAEVFRVAPAGDIVEIGSWWGKSAFVLLYLAQRYQVGKLLCVDPWSDTHLVQDDKLVDEASSEMSADEAHEVFVTNLIPYANGGINFMRTPSVDGAAAYGANTKVVTEAFGNTQYSGEISLLHIDGNHALDAVMADTKAWAHYVTQGGWIVFDDYKWPYGDGPRIVADNFISTNSKNIAAAFYMGGAMFVQMSN
jgi:cephalosporin hydroxylase